MPMTWVHLVHMRIDGNEVVLEQLNLVNTLAGFDIVERDYMTISSLLDNTAERANALIDLERRRKLNECQIDEQQTHTRGASARENVSSVRMRSARPWWPKSLAAFWSA